VTLAIMVVLFGAKYFRTQADSRVMAGSASTNDLAIESLSNKIVAQNQERQSLEVKRAILASSAKETAIPALAPGERTRRALVGELIHLLALEKQYSEGSPEITNTREQIDALQSQIAELPPVNQHIQSMSIAANPSQLELAAVDQQLSVHESATKANVSELGRLVRAKELADSQQFPRKGLDALSIVGISLFCGLIVAFLIVALARHYSVRDETALRELLPRSAELIGAIPHMRVIS
jgi:hypothetical protein